MPKINLEDSVSLSVGLQSYDSEEMLQSCIQRKRGELFVKENTAEYRVKADLRFHIVFTVKNREPILTYGMLAQIRDIINGKADSLNCVIHIANGHLDHLHMLVSLPSKISLSEFVGQIKGFSSYEILDLYWQRGFFAETVSPQDVDKIFNYIKYQEKRHKLL